MRRGRKRARKGRFLRGAGYAAAGVLLVLAALAGPSYVRAITAPGNTSLAVRTVEWVRNHHGGFLVAKAEDVWYTLNQPPRGGPTLHRLPRRAPTRLVSSGSPIGTAAALPRPARIEPLMHPALPGEGVWRPAGQVFGGKAPILETTFRPDPSHPTVVAGVAWIDTRMVRLELIPGRKQPHSRLGPGEGEVPAAQRSALLATFNSGFKTQDGHGGFIARGRVYVRPRSGLGTIAVYRSGRVDVGSWGKEIKPSPNIEYLRQNLPLIVDHARPTHRTLDPTLWGTTVGNTVYVWRSAVGVDAHGGLIYAAADGVTTRGLAEIMVRAGAVRAMQLDINPYWVDFFTYDAPGGKGPSKLLPTMLRPNDRYLTPDDRDFFAVLRRR
ncbi:phosphodiester glycosidase family protein [Rubrobacter naiadicus]|uniref:phosphodiester glycosidase family protein n=1 Tax=Rubrobacter naiadicus TaxID=1392641 RepID=UPI0023620E16|nr:phosphodiester glycosidase family protein [Rubrobacter naiadicus]